jgi:hypothetical protein
LSYILDVLGYYFGAVVILSKNYISLEDELDKEWVRQATTR